MGKAASCSATCRNLPTMTFSRARIKLTPSVSNSRLMKGHKIWRLNNSFLVHVLICPQKWIKIFRKTRVMRNLSNLTTSNTATCHTWMTLRMGSAAISNRSILSTDKTREIQFLELKIITLIIKMSSKSTQVLRSLADKTSIYSTRKSNSRWW